LLPLEFLLARHGSARQRTSTGSRSRGVRRLDVTQTRRQATHGSAAGGGGGGRWKRAAAGSDVRLTVKRLTRAAKAHVATAARRTACLHVSRAMQAARRRSAFDFPSRLGRRAEAGPRRVLPRSCAAPGSFLTFSPYCSGHTDAAAHNISDLGFPESWQNLCAGARDLWRLPHGSDE